jgi:hypothetical protein
MGVETMNIVEYGNKIKNELVKNGSVQKMLLIGFDTDNMALVLTVAIAGAYESRMTVEYVVERLTLAFNHLSDSFWQQNIQKNGMN